MLVMPGINYSQIRSNIKLAYYDSKANYVPSRDCVAAAVLVGASVDPIVLTRVLRASGVVE